MAAIIGVLSLGMVSVIVYQLVRNGSQGPVAIKNTFSGVAGIYTALMK
jgi:hypothetical protein